MLQTAEFSLVTLDLVGLAASLLPQLSCVCVLVCVCVGVQVKTMWVREREFQVNQSY